MFIVINIKFLCVVINTQELNINQILRDSLSFVMLRSSLHFSLNPARLRGSLWACRCGTRTLRAWSSPGTPRCQVWCLCSSGRLLRGGWSSGCAPRAGPNPEHTTEPLQNSLIHSFRWRFVDSAHRVSGHQHWLADERGADLEVLQPAVDVIVGVHGAGGELSRLPVSRHKATHQNTRSSQQRSIVCSLPRPTFTMMWILAFPFWMMKVPPRARLLSG